MTAARGLVAVIGGIWLGAAQAEVGPSYADSVDRAVTVVRSAPAGDRSAAAEAARVLQAGTGSSQPEILDDLRATPPRLDDARVRLTSLERAVRNPSFTPEPRKADDAVHGILSQPRYADLQAGPSLWDRLRGSVVRLAVWLLDRLAPSGGVPGWIRWIVPPVALVLLLVASVLLLRAARGRGRNQPRMAARAAGSQQAASDRFADADRLAAVGDLTGAVRALAGGVAAALGDDRDWEVSPLTVREIFRRSPDPDALGPLLAAFESAVYGGRQLDLGRYAAADAAAHPYRSPSREKAA